MFYGFDTHSEEAGIAAMLVFAIWRSRDANRLKITPDVWGRVERAVRSAAKRSGDLHDFIERLKPKLHCSTIQPRWMWQGDTPQVTVAVNRGTDEVYELYDSGRRQFWTRILEECNHDQTLHQLYRRTSLVIALVRDRLERERVLEERGLLNTTAEETQSNATNE